MWPALKTLIIVFWLATTFLLVRNAYFTETSQMPEIPARVILKAFLEPPSSAGTSQGRGTALNTLQIFHYKTKIGYASINSRKLTSEQGGYGISFTGNLDAGAIASVEGEVIPRLDLKLNKNMEWVGIDGQVRIPKIVTVFDFQWPAGDKFPHFQLKQKNEIKLNDQIAAPFLAQAFLGKGGVLPGGLTIPTAESAEGMIKMVSREGMLMIAGEKQRGYVMEFTVMDQYKATAYFTEAGELARVELPEGYKLLEAMVYKLDPDLDEEEKKKPGK